MEEHHRRQTLGFGVLLDAEIAGNRLVADAGDLDVVNVRPFVRDMFTFDLFYGNFGKFSFDTVPELIEIGRFFDRRSEFFGGDHHTVTAAAVESDSSAAAFDPLFDRFAVFIDKKKADTDKSRLFCGMFKNERLSGISFSDVLESFCVTGEIASDIFASRRIAVFQHIGGDDDLVADIVDGFCVVDFEVNSYVPCRDAEGEQENRGRTKKFFNLDSTFSGKKSKRAR